MSRWNKTKIVITLGPASANKKILRSIIRAGADVIRLNGAHGTVEEHKKNISLVRRISDELNTPVGIILDLPGPKLRIGILKKEPVQIKKGDIAKLVTGRRKQVNDEIPIEYRGLTKRMKPGDQIYLNDGIIDLTVKQIRGSTITCKVKSGGELRSRKGINLPNTSLAIPSITKKDRELVKLAVKSDVDYVALSFVRSASDVKKLKRILKKAPHIRTIAKIEKPEALNEIDEIIKISDVLMVARGDLGIEMQLPKVPAIQRELLRKCNIAKRLSIIATQMLESMVTSSSPTRAEVTDVANAVWEGSDAIMLSAETSIGKNPVRAVQEMVRIATEAEKEEPYRQTTQKIDKNKKENVGKSLSNAAAVIADKINAKAIVTPTRDGQTALFISKERPIPPIIALTEDNRVTRQMSLYWGVMPITMKKFKSLDELLESAENHALKTRLIRKGDLIVIVSGANIDNSRSPSIIQIRKVADL